MAVEEASGGAAPVSTGRIGPSGQKLKGPEQKTAAVVVPAQPDAVNLLVAPDIEKENVHKVYDTIASHWDHTRYKAWPRVEEFIRSRPRGSIVADLGCGNGKNIPAISETGCYPVASDICAPLVRIAADSHGTGGVFVGDCLHSPLRDGIFDAAISIAVLHHLSTVPRRVQALREGARLLRPGGELLVYCWSFEQGEDISRSRHRFAAQDVLVPFHYRQPQVKKPKEPKAKDQKASKKKGGGYDQEKPQAACDEAAATDADAAAGKAEAASGATAASESPKEEAAFQEDTQVQQRYCHVYSSGELLGLLEQVPELEVVEHYFDTGNWCAIARKKA
eukprot:TRINITY_DN52345_c0_g2_i1.p1 TRINITY_DN52345_c0_g2~~TRINITY_DN52345_c0_g2_i1.p1  ORF type:complete len:382 (-),score=77.07 TRINITY_DN52345_c0_g2_i1:67-1071(-)